MKILQINKFHYIKGGSERVFFDTIKILEKAGHQVSVFSMEDKLNLSSKYSNYFVKNIDYYKKQGLLDKISTAIDFVWSSDAKVNLEKLIKKEKPDIAHLHNFTHQLSPSILSVLKKHNIPVVQTLHDYQLICPNGRLFTQNKICERCKKTKFYNAIIHKCLYDSYAGSALGCLDLYLQRIFTTNKERIDLFIAPSKFMKKKTKDWGIKNKIVHLRYSLDLKDFQPNPTPGKYLIFVGRLSSEKGLFTLLKAMKNLPKVQLKIVGTGPIEKDLKDFTKKKGLKNVEFTGRKTGQSLKNLISKSRVVVVPSEWYENYPVAVLEAKAMAKPVLGADIGGIPEQVKDGKTGWLFKSGNVKDLTEKIQVIYFDDEKIEKAGLAARKSVEKQNSEQKYLESLEKIYEKLVSL